MTEAPRDFRPRAIYIALFLMAVGMTIYAAFRIVQSAWLVMAGMAWIPIGCLFVLVGLIDLRRSPPPRWKPYLLLFANFPVALLCMLSAVDVMSRVEVYVTNDEVGPLTDVRLILRSFDSGEDVVRLPDLPPGGRWAGVLRPEEHAELWLAFRTEDGEQQVCVSGYLSGGAAGDYLDVTVSASPFRPEIIDPVRPTFLWPVLP